MNLVEKSLGITLSLNAPLRLKFDENVDCLGRGTVGEVFRVSIEQQHQRFSHYDELPGQQVFALKRFLLRDDRFDFAKECSILKALSIKRHPNILHCLHSWTLDGRSYILFPLAQGDLYQMLRKPLPVSSTTQIIPRVLQQLLGITDAVEYIHSYEVPNSYESRAALKRRVGFHHDLKPANIVIFNGSQADQVIWKITDFGSGAIEYVDSSSSLSIYNVKPSTGDPTYSAPEFVSEGKVSQPKDIWSLGCIFMEIAVWLADPSTTVLDEFERRRVVALGIDEPQDPTFWSQDEAGRLRLNPAVDDQLIDLERLRRGKTGLEYLLPVIRKALTVCHKRRATASDICTVLRFIINS